MFSRRDGQIRHAYCTELLLAAADPEQDAEHVAGAGDSVRRHDMALDFEAERLERTGSQVCVPGAIAGRVVGESLRTSAARNSTSAGKRLSIMSNRI